MSSMPGLQHVMKTYSGRNVPPATSGNLCLALSFALLAASCMVAARGEDNGMDAIPD
jgi:hypothetical protein